jgi:DNA-binding NarL/FixJ family response regulator
MSKTRILIVEDEPAIAKFIEKTLKNTNYQVSGLAFDDEDAITELEENKPHVVLLDINLGSEMDGIDIANLINQKYQIPFIFITSYHNRQTLERAKPTRPVGYIVKPFTEEDLLTTLEISLFNYSQRFQISDLTLENINAKTDTPLTKREYEILKGIYAGKNNQELAEDQFVSVNTIKTHIRNLYVKMDVTSRWALLVKLREMF